VRDAPAEGLEDRGAAQLHRPAAVQLWLRLQARRIESHDRGAQVTRYFILLGLTACAARQKTDELIPAAKSIAIYSAGGSVVSGVIDPIVLGTRRLHLPATATAINLYQDNQSLKWFTVESTQENKNDPASEKYKLIGLPALKAQELQFKYGL